MILKFLNKHKYAENKFAKKLKKQKQKYIEIIKPELSKMQRQLKKKEVSFLHSGHLGDLINSLPLIKQISKKSKCNLYIEVGKQTDNFKVTKEFYLSKGGVEKILPLLKKQNYINHLAIYQKQKININLNFFRTLDINFNIDSVRWYSHLVGIHPPLELPYIKVDKHKKFRNKIVIVRSLRRQNNLISYKFLNKYKNILFIGLKTEYLSLKKDIKNLSFYDCKNFLEMAEIIKGCKLFIGNLSFGYALAEAIKVPRLLESNPEFSLVYPNGKKAYDFYFQEHFEKLVLELNK